MAYLLIHTQTDILRNNDRTVGTHWCWSAQL